MDRRSLLVLGAGLLVGEPVRRAYSFLNGHGLGDDVRSRTMAFIRAEVERSLTNYIVNGGVDAPRMGRDVERFLAGLKLTEPVPVVVRSVYHPGSKSIVCTVRLPSGPVSTDLGPFDE